MENKQPSYHYQLLIIALFFGALIHGATLFSTFQRTYDAWVHIFFADHYSRMWFEPWEPRWYTGFFTVSYPPLSHQVMALLSKLAGFKIAFVIAMLCAIMWFVIGMYRFASLFVSTRAAGYAALVGVFASSIMETVHVFGQLPTMFGISCLLNALPNIYYFIRFRKFKFLAIGLLILGIGTVSHHVTTLFGMVFFVAPLVLMAVYDRIEQDVNKLIFKKLNTFIREIFGSWLYIACLVLIPTMIIVLVFPYWAWSKSDPISQIPIPHGSRDNFLENSPIALMFFIVPWASFLMFLPYGIKQLVTGRNLFFGLSFLLMFLLGTGGTTPFPRLILGENAFNILTLDRFTFWAIIIFIPFMGQFLERMLEGVYKRVLIQRFGKWVYRIFLFACVVVILVFDIFILNLTFFRPMQPDPIDPGPITSFIDKDEHYRWRYLCLGFGDQMAWVSANTTALTVDGNYHSARRLPELTSRTTERLEGAKYKGVQGLGSLKQFLTVPEAYNLKFIFSNDKFYDPLLYFCGWERILRLENGIMVWHKHDIPPLPKYLPSKDLPKYQKWMWSFIPIGILCIGLLVVLFQQLFTRNFSIIQILNHHHLPIKEKSKRIYRYLGFVWFLGTIGMFIYYFFITISLDNSSSPNKVITEYYNALDFKYFDKAVSYFDPDSEFSKEQFELEYSLNHGVLSSFAKLDEIKITYDTVSANLVTAKVDEKWLTSLYGFDSYREYDLVKRKEKWYILPNEFDPSIPKKTFEANSQMTFFSHGKRRADAHKSSYDDILDRPDLAFSHLNLVALNDSSYHVVGTILNRHTYPCHITIRAELYNDKNEKIIENNAQGIVVHNLLSNEETSFRIDFDEVAWSSTYDLHTGEYDPEKTNLFKFIEKPSYVKIFAKAVVVDKDLYKSTAFENIQFSPKNMSGFLHNRGSEEVSIPKVIVSFFDKKNKLLWVDGKMLKEGVRPYRKRFFEIDFDTKLEDIEITPILEQNISINGTSTVFVPFIPNKNQYDIQTQSLNIKLHLDQFIANPTIY